MKAIHLTAYGNPAQNLKMVEIPEPNAPSADEALVRMEYAPVDYSDLLLANGVYFLNPKLPSVIGGEGAGIVEAIGPGVTDVKVGDRVTSHFAPLPGPEGPCSGRRSFCCSPINRCEDGLDVKHQSNHSRSSLDGFVKLKPGDWIVLNAANSQVGRCLIAVAKSRGLKVIGIVRRPELVPELEKLGVDLVSVDSPELPKQIQKAPSGMPISLGLDAVGGPAAAAIASALSPGAHFVSYAWLSGSPIHLPQGDLIGKRLNIQGFWMYYEEFLPRIRAAVTEATQVVASGRLNLPITATYKPSQIKEAIEHYQRGGKVLLDFNE